ncbi:MAG: hypothetical protein Q8936_02660 [Bacillota bacterium]|nr:hypothetical protein [Bacillota bacterium]
MKLEISEFILSKLKYIESIPNNRFTRIRRYNAINNLLEEEECKTNPALIKYLLEFIFFEEDYIIEKTLKCISDALENLEIIDWISLSEDVKNSDYYGNSRKMWFSLEADGLNEFKKFHKYKYLIFGLASLHRNGYVRERAVMELGGLNTGKELLYLTLRINDWVEEIAKLSEKYLTNRISFYSGNSFIELLPLIYHMGLGGRRNHSKLMEKIEITLKNKQNINMLEYYVDSGDRYLRRACYELICDINRNSYIPVINMGLKNPDTVVQRRAIKLIFSKINEANANSFYILIKSEKRSSVRRYAPYILGYCKNLDVIEELKGFLLDNNKSIREKARYYLRKEGYSDFISFYREALYNNEKSIYAAIFGIGEVGTREDAVILEKYFDIKDIKIRKAVLSVLRKLDGEGYQDLFLKNLSSILPGISKEARKALEVSISTIDEEKLWQIIKLDIIPEHVFQNILYLFRKMPKWMSIIQFLRLLKLNNDQVNELVNCELLDWIYAFNRSFTKPSEQEISLIKEYYGTNKNKIDEQIQKHIEELIK